MAAGHAPDVTGEDDPSPGAIERILARRSAETAPYAALTLGILLLAFSLIGQLLDEGPRARFIPLMDAGVGVAFVLLYAWTARRPVLERFAHAALAGLAGLILADVAISMWAVRNPQQTVYLMVLAVGAGGVFLSLRWLVGLLAAILASWLPVALVASGEWSFYGYALGGSFAVAMLLQVLRLRNVRRMERLRILERMRARELEARQRALEEAMGAVAESELRYRLLVEHAPDAIMVQSEGRWVYVNAAAVRLFGASRPEDLVGTPAIERVHPDDRALVEARTRQIVREGRATERREIRALRLDGHVIHIEVMGIPVTWNGKPADQSIVRDVTERLEAEAGRRLAAERLAEIARLQEMERVRTRFLNTVSHELRTPLTPIKVQLHLLKASAGERHARALDVLERNIVRLNGLLDDLLEVARIQEGHLRLDRSLVDLQSVVREATESFDDVARLAKVKLEVALEPGLRAEADPHRVTQVLFNLCGNALKFTPDGGLIRVAARRVGEDVEISVSDTGAGIAPEDVGKLFEPFSQVHDTAQQTRAGTGLGLFICRGIVEAHGGRIWCESGGRERGSTFRFTIPMRGSVAVAGGAADDAPRAS